MIAVEPVAASSRDPRSPLSGGDHGGDGTAPSTPRDDCGWRSSKSRPRHLERQAIVYVRQSTPHQMAENRESLCAAICVAGPRRGTGLAGVESRAD